MSTFIGWTCPNCRSLVPDGCTHSCPTTVLVPTQITVAPTAEERIADALERIAAALEAAPSPVPTQEKERE